MKRISLPWMMCASMVAGSGITGAHAADQVLEEIVVTATKRETPVQRTPISITALTDTALRNAAVTDTRKLAAVVPGLTITGDAGLGTTPIAIRGIGSAGNGIGSDDPVALYVDGVYLGRPASTTSRPSTSGTTRSESRRIR